VKGKSCRSFIGIAAIAAALLLPGGCATTAAPIQEVQNAPVATRSGQPLAANDIAKAIERAGDSLGWQLTADGPGVFTGRLLLRSHVAVVAIEYDVKAYSILYRESVNLGANEGLIHPAYNQWIHSLDRAIRAELDQM